MLRLEGLLLIGLFGIGLLLAGYWLAHLLDSPPSERVAAGLLGGLGSILLMVSAVNFFAPLRGAWAAACLLPCAATLCWAAPRGALWGDLRRLAGRRRASWLGLTAAIFLALLLWPLLSTPDLIFHDGTGNHDNFFWIVGAEHLQAHTYMEPLFLSLTHPFDDATDNLLGWTPMWGRMGSEGLNALAASLSGRPVIEIYGYAVAALFLPWFAGVYLIVRSFVRERPPVVALLAAACLQPVFVFFYANGNVPNLVGALMAAGMMIATQRFSRGGATRVRERWAWWGLLVLSTHGLLCSYPEMLPFVLLPCGLLWLRMGPGLRPGARDAGILALAFVAAPLINPATGARALSGFLMSFDAARTYNNWGNLFHNLRPPEYVPALTSLSVSACEFLGPWAGGGLSMLLVVMLALTVARARDSFGAAAILTGAGALFVYTLVTGFSYGWQKTVQFAGVPIGALFPCGCLAALYVPGKSPPRWMRILAAGTLIFCYGAGVIWLLVRSYDHARQKFITREMLSLRAASRVSLPQGAALVLPETFEKPYFYGMWATYLLPCQPIRFLTRVRENRGGYLWPYALAYRPGKSPKPACVLESRAWADTIDANASRVIDGRDMVVVRETNLVLGVKGLFPESGVPRRAAINATLDLAPFKDALLHIAVRPWDATTGQGAGFRVQNHIEGEPGAREVRVSGAGSWTVAVPLKGGVHNQITMNVEGATSADEFPLSVEVLRVNDD